MTRRLEDPGLLRRLYAAAALVGVSLATLGVVESRPSLEAFGEAGVAHVDDASITLRRYREILSDMATDSREPLGAAERAFALERLIDEELLILRARELRLDRSVPAIRKAMSSAVIAQIVADASADVPSDDALRDFYRSDRAFFRPPAQYRARWFTLPGLGDGDEALAKRIHSRVEGGDFQDTELADELPHRPLPASTMSAYLGATLTSTLEELEPGDFSEPAFVRGSWHILELTERIDPPTSGFDELEPLVRAEYLRHRSDQALLEYLAWLRSRADIRIDYESAGLDPP